jgi:enoyl reductase-like protein
MKLNDKINKIEEILQNIDSCINELENAKEVLENNKNELIQIMDDNTSIYYQKIRNVVNSGLCPHYVDSEFPISVSVSNNYTDNSRGIEFLKKVKKKHFDEAIYWTRNRNC